MERHLVPGGRYLGGDAGVAIDVLPDEEEGSAHAGPIEQCQYRRRALRVRTVVEGESDVSVRDEPLPNAQNGP